MRLEVTRMSPVRLSWGASVPSVRQSVDHVATGYRGSPAPVTSRFGATGWADE